MKIRDILENEDNTEQYYAWFIQDPDTKKWTIPALMTPEGPAPMVCNTYSVALKMEPMLRELSTVTGYALRLSRFHKSEVMKEFAANEEILASGAKGVKTIHIDLSDENENNEGSIQDFLEKMGLAARKTPTPERH